MSLGAASAICDIEAHHVCSAPGRVGRPLSPQPRALNARSESKTLNPNRGEKWTAHARLGAGGVTVRGEVYNSKTCSGFFAH